jgi:hypothetical protein
MAIYGMDINGTGFLRYGAGLPVTEVVVNPCRRYLVFLKETYIMYVI